MALGLGVLLLLAGGPLVTRSPSPSPARSREIVVAGCRLRPAPAGGYVCHNEAFGAHIAVDGTVTFHDRGGCPRAVAAPDLGVEARKSPTAPARDRRPRRKLVPLVSDETFRRDSHHAQKMTFLESTAELRETMRKANEAAALVAWQDRVDRVASDRRVPAERRRGLLFELWLECDEAERSAPARAAVEAVVRRHLPVGGPDAYRPDELQRLNQDRPAGSRFDPYASR